MDNEQRALIREIATEAASEIVDRLEAQFKMRLDLHQATCPARRWPKQMAFLMIGVGVGSGAGTVGLLKLLSLF